MLTISDLSADLTLDSAAMTDVRGGASETPVFVTAYSGLFNAPTIDMGLHEAVQGQSSMIDQSGNLGGFSAVASSQTQNGLSGQFSFF